jgi:hypothetical protein
MATKKKRRPKKKTTSSKKRTTRRSSRDKILRDLSSSMETLKSARDAVVKATRDESPKKRSAASKRGWKSAVKLTLAQWTARKRKKGRKKARRK